MSGEFRNENKGKDPSQGFTIDKHKAIKAGFILALIVFLALIYGTNRTNDVDLSKLEKTIVKECNLNQEMSKASDRDLARFLGIDAESVKQVVYYRSTKELAVEELLIVKTDSTSAANAIGEAVESRVKSQIDTYASYGPAQVAQLENCIKYRVGPYYFYCTSDNAAKYEEVFDNAVQ